MYPSSAFPIIIVSDLFFERRIIPTSAQIAASNLSWSLFLGFEIKLASLAQVASKLSPSVAA
jgi:hypothetical protein